MAVSVAAAVVLVAPAKPLHGGEGGRHGSGRRQSHGSAGALPDQGVERQSRVVAGAGQHQRHPRRSEHAVGSQVVGVAVPADRQQEPDRQLERPVPQGRASSRALPHRAVGAEGALPRRHRATPQPVQPDRPDQRLEADAQRPHHPLRRPHRGRPLTMTITTAYTARRKVLPAPTDVPFGARWLSADQDVRCCHSGARSARLRIE